MFQPRTNVSKPKKRRDRGDASDSNEDESHSNIVVDYDIKRKRGIREKFPEEPSSGIAAHETTAASFVTPSVLNGEDAVVHAGVVFESELDPRAQYDRIRDIQNKIDSGELEEGVYRGLNAYRAYVQPDDDRKISSANMTGGLGPNRAMANVRTTCRFDYQADVCKDYKETGYCGFGDSCKFLHDRSDYKTGWELEHDWDAQERQREKERLESIARRIAEQKGEYVHEEVTNESQKCGLCNKAWKDCLSDACVTTCGHYFCESCFLAKCWVTCSQCGKATHGIFNSIS